MYPISKMIRKKKKSLIYGTTILLAQCTEQNNCYNSTLVLISA